MFRIHRPRLAIRRPAAGLLLLAAALAALLAAAAPRAAAAQVVTYRGVRITVPTGWPVYRLAQHPRTCVRFDRHAVYLGTPGGNEACPAHAAGRTGAILVSPSGLVHAHAAGGGSATRIARGAAVITATWHDDASQIKQALGVGWLPAAPRPSAAPRAAMRPMTARRPHAALATAAPAPGSVYTGQGFDACSTPSAAQMSSWGTSPYRAIGVYIGGTNMACAQPNLTSTWVGSEAAAGWHVIPIYVGLQAPSNSCGCASISTSSAAAQGAAAASDAIAQAQAIGLGTGNPLYVDMEGYNRTSANSTAVLTFLGAWTSQLHAEGYLSGVYSSAASGIRDLVAEVGTGYAEPDDIWIANWNNAQSTADSNVPAPEWSAHQRLHQYDGAHNATYGGVTINIDSDYLDAATASPGSTTTAAATTSPTLGVRATPGGAIDLSPGWPGVSSVSSWQVFGGSSPTALTATGSPVSAGGTLPIVSSSAYAYFQVEALDATGQVLGSSPVVQTPAHVSIYGNSVFVPRHGPASVPVQCFDIPTCAVTMTVSTRSRLVRTGPESLSTLGGLAFFSLSPAGHALVASARHRRLGVSISVRTSTGKSVKRTLNLVPYAVSGRAPRRSLRSSGDIRLLSATLFVSNGWSGGILAECVAATPCTPTTSMLGSGATIARTAQQSLGVNQIGYLPFRLTPYGHGLITHARGNQLGVGADVFNATTTAHGAFALTAFR